MGSGARSCAATVVLMLVAVAMTACTGGVTPQSGPRSSASPAPVGTPGWQLSHPGPEHAIEGFADRTSVLPGQDVRLFVSTTATHYTVTGYRMGAYRDSDALQVWKSGPQPGHQQAAAVVRAPTNTVVAPWQPSITVPMRGWQPGD